MYSDVSRKCCAGFQDASMVLEMVLLVLLSSRPKVPAIERRFLADCIWLSNRIHKRWSHKTGLEWGLLKHWYQHSLIFLKYSWFTLHRLELNPAFLIEYIASWQLSAAYQVSLNNLHALRLSTTALVWSSDQISCLQPMVKNISNVLQAVVHDCKYYSQLVMLTTKKAVNEPTISDILLLTNELKWLLYFSNISKCWSQCYSGW